MIAPGFLDLRSLDGRSVVVKTTTGQQGQPSTLTGTIEVRAEAGAPRPRVGIMVYCADAFGGVAEHRSIPLDDHALARLLASERAGRFEFAVPPSLD